MTTCSFRTCLILFLLSSCISSAAQDYVIDAELITPENGLSGITTYCILQDNDHFIWVSTNNGLDRFDGSQFNFFSSSDYLLDKKYIGRMKMGEDHLLWLFDIPSLINRYRIFPIKELSVFNTKDQKVLSGLEFKKIKKIFQQGSYYLPKTTGWPAKVFFANQKGELWTYNEHKFQLLKTGILDTIRTIYHVDDHLYLGTDSTLIETDLSGKTKRSTKLPGYLLDIWVEEDQTIWASTTTKASTGEMNLWKINPDLTYEPFYLRDRQENEAQLFLQPNLGDYIYRTKKGLWLVNLGNQCKVYDSSGRQIIFLNEEFSSQYSFGFRGLIDLGNTFLLATSGGVIRLTIEPNRFKLIHSRPTFNNSRTITQGPGKSLIFNETFIERVDSNFKNPETIYAVNSGFGLYYQDSTIWFGDGYKRIASIIEQNLFTGEQTTYPSFPGEIVYCIKPTQKPDLLWVGGNFGLALINIKHKSILPPINENGHTDFSKSSVKYIHSNPSGYWLATDHGIFLVTEEAGVLRQFNKSSGDLPFDDIAYIHEDSAGIFWLATLGAGMLKWEPSLDTKKRSAYQIYDIDSGLSHNIIYGIQEDEINRLWISSNRGLMLFDKITEDLVTFLEQDGLPHSEFNLTSHYKNADGILFFGGLGGIVAVDPSAFGRANKTKTPLVFTGFKVLEEDAMQATDYIDRIVQDKEITFLLNQKFLEFEVQLLDFDQTKNHQYAYKIEGFSDVWNYLSTNNFRIAHLPFGNYTLRIKGGNINQGWSSQELSLDIKVPKPFYLKEWFFAGLALFFVLSSWCLIKIRNRQLKKDRTRLARKVKERTTKIEADKVIIEEQAQKLKTLDQLKTNFFTNITHELRTPLSLILGPASELSNKNDLSLENQNLAKTINKNARNLLGLTDELLDLAHIDAGTLGLDKTVVNLQSFLKYILDNYLEFANYQQIDFSYEFSFPSDLNLELDARKVEKILNNLLSNAFKFTPSHGVIKVSCSWATGQLQLKVSDTGKGIDPQMQPFIFDRYFQSNNETNQLGIGGSGIGLAICREYLQLMDGSIQLCSEPNKGTTFKIMLPAKQVIKKEAIRLHPLNSLVKASSIKSGLKNSMQVKEASKYQLLIVEDNIELGIYLKSVLDKSYTIELAHNGKEAWQLIQQEHFDLLISDVMMPEMNGIELLSKVKSHDRYQNIPFMMLTALSAGEERMKALRIGVDDYLQKPFLTEEVELRIELLLDRYSIRKTTKLDSETPLSADESWLKHVEKKTLELVSNPDFTVVQLAMILNVSERNLFNKLRALVGIAPGAYIREVRLIYARDLLEQKRYKTVAEVCYAVGFQKPSYFTQLFKKRFGHLPSKYFK
ncbi:MAG: hypothetical protein Sapg2KO_25120 [Saprospiraceae bacterium]